MNTRDVYYAPFLPERRKGDYVFILEHLELAFPREQLEEITEQWNNGMELEDIAEYQKRNPQEVFLALFHQAIKNKIKRAFAYRRKLK